MQLLVYTRSLDYRLPVLPQALGETLFGKSLWGHLVFPRVLGNFPEFPPRIHKVRAKEKIGQHRYDCFLEEYTSVYPNRALPCKEQIRLIYNRVNYVWTLLSSNADEKSSMLGRVAL